MAIQGIDVSHYQKAIDWEKVANAGVQFAYAKASEGASFTDPMFATNFAGIRGAGLLRGAYHFFDAGAAPLEQVACFLKVLGPPVASDLPPMLDLESGESKDGPTIVSGALQWLDQVQKAVGRTPVLYCSASFWTDVLGNPEQLMEFPFWIANYTLADQPTLPAGRASYALWQYAQTGTVDGISTHVDLDWFNGSLDQLRQLGMGSDA